MNIGTLLLLAGVGVGVYLLMPYQITPNVDAATGNRWIPSPPYGAWVQLPAGAALPSQPNWCHFVNLGYSSCPYNLPGGF